jgi:predicted RNA binding protein YcfA (HicA-like mRNA interferase family)
MKRRDFLRHLAAHGCQLLREGGRHSIFFNPQTGATSSIPRHTEISDFLARKICRDLGIPQPD